ncbi:uncharacterized protein [Littorina saxatilis]|uniref:uncharacterized protein n=1 Tax=Littorina saxatilis TaxID=31220 RepID=UPI0038B685FA
MLLLCIIVSASLSTFKHKLVSDVHSQDPGVSVNVRLVERLKKIEDLWSILSRRVTRIEQRVQPSDLPAGMVNEEEEEEAKSAPIGEAELRDINNELAELKADVIQHTEGGAHRGPAGGDGTEDGTAAGGGGTEDGTAAGGAEQDGTAGTARRVARGGESKEVGSLREELDQHREHVKHQEDWFNAENLRMKNKMVQQETALKQQETKVNDLQETEHEMRQSLEEQHDDLKEQRRLMEEQSYQPSLLTRHIMKVATMATNNKSATTTNKNQKETDNKRAETSKPRKQSNTSGDSDNEYARDVIGGRDVTVDADGSGAER